MTADAGDVDGGQFERCLSMTRGIVTSSLGGSIVLMCELSDQLVGFGIGRRHCDQCRIRQQHWRVNINQCRYFFCCRWRQCFDGGQFVIFGALSCLESGMGLSRGALLVIRGIWEGPCLMFESV